MADETAVEIALDDGTGDVIRVSPDIAKQLGKKVAKAEAAPEAEKPKSKFDGMTKAELVENAKLAGLTDKEAKSKSKDELIDVLENWK